MTGTYLFERNDLLREGLKSCLTGTDFHVTAEFEHVDGIDIADTLSPPDLVITGVNTHAIHLPLPEFEEDIGRLRNHFPQAKLVILTSAEEIRTMPKIICCNADGYILRDIPRDAILNYLNLAMIGERALPGLLAPLFAAARAELAPCPSTAPPNVDYYLSGRENDIVQCLMLGESNKLIARRLNITESTVKGHLKTILRKLGVQNRTQAAVRAFMHRDKREALNDLLAA